MSFDTIIRDGRWFDGTGAPSAIRDIGIRDGAVHRLTGELADWYQIDAGHLRIGDRADFVVIDPQRLDATLDDYAEDTVEQYAGLLRMVNRNDDTVNAVFVGGRAVFLDGQATDVVGTQRTGSFLRASTTTSVPIPADAL